MTNTQHVHNWNLIRTFVGEGEPKIKQQMVVPPIGSDDEPKIKMWTDCRQEYVLYHCECGEKKEVEL